MSLKIIEDIGEFSLPPGGTVATIGTFDGLHRGHQAIFRQLMAVAEKKGMAPLAITFEPHPRVLVTPGTAPPLLTIWEEKIDLFRKYMDGMVLVLPFNAAFMNMTAEEFTRDYLVKRLGIKFLIVGYDHAFGKNRSGTVNDLMELSRKYFFELNIVDPVIVEGRPISSSRIRRLMGENRYYEAVQMLGHPYPIYGRVIKGIGLGRKIGFPTANIGYAERKLLPSSGVYTSRIYIENRLYDGMMFIGQNHFNPGAGISVEVNVFDFDREIYDIGVTCYPEVFLRENRLFGNTAELVKQLYMDKENVQRIKEKGENRNVC